MAVYVSGNLMTIYIKVIILLNQPEGKHRRVILIFYLYHIDVYNILNEATCYLCSLLTSGAGEIENLKAQNPLNPLS